MKPTVGQFYLIKYSEDKEDQFIARCLSNELTEIEDCGGHYLFHDGEEEIYIEPDYIYERGLLRGDLCKIEYKDDDNMNYDGLYIMGYLSVIFLNHAEFTAPGCDGYDRFYIFPLDSIKINYGPPPSYLELLELWTNT